MSGESVAVVADAYRAFAIDGLDRFLDYWTDDLEHRSMDGDPVYRDPIHGKKAMGVFLQDWIDTFDEFGIEPVELIDAGGKRSSRCCATADAPG
ncbi:MAG: hypothetical protein ACRDLL_01270 [Solirubrobacterales bacterium]